MKYKYLNSNINYNMGIIHSSKQTSYKTTKYYFDNIELIDEDILIDMINIDKDFDINETIIFTPKNFKVQYKTPIYFWSLIKNKIKLTKFLLLNYKSKINIDKNYDIYFPKKISEYNQETRNYYSVDEYVDVHHLKINLLSLAIYTNCEDIIIFLLNNFSNDLNFENCITEKINCNNKFLTVKKPYYDTLILDTNSNLEHKEIKGLFFDFTNNNFIVLFLQNPNIIEKILIGEINFNFNEMLNIKIFLVFMKKIVKSYYYEKLLLELLKNFDVDPFEGELIYCAIKNNYTMIAKYLLENNPNYIDYLDKEYNSKHLKTILSLTASKGNLELSNIILEKKFPEDYDRNDLIGENLLELQEIIKKNNMDIKI